MNIRQILLAAGISLACVSSAFATTFTTIDCSNAEFSSKISSASNGDTVQGPVSGGTNTGGGTRIDIPSTKGLTIDGRGCTINWGFGLTTNATVKTRITNFTFTKNGDNTGPNASFKTLGASLTNARWRLDHCTFTGGGHNIIELGPEPGLVDHISLTNAGAAEEQIHITAWGNSDTTGWTTGMPSTGSLATGTDEAIYFEDDTFSATSFSQGNSGEIQSYYGARVVYRYNTFNYVKIDAHGGGAPNISTRWLEVYKNDYHSMIGGNAGGYFPSVRGGSGIIFSNTTSGTLTPVPGIGYCDETPGNPAYFSDYQVGRGTSQALAPAYAWNSTQTIAVNSCEGLASNNPDAVAFNRDVYTDVNSADCTAGGACNAGMAQGTTLPITCATNTGFWKTDAGGNWDTTHGGSNDGALYKCTSIDTWTLYYTPYVYPNPLQGGACVPSKVIFTSQPANAPLGVSLGTISVTVEDSGGVTCTSDTSTVTLAKTGGTCTSMTLNGTVSGSAVLGVFTTTDVNMTAATGACTLTATDGALTSAISSSFTISSPAIGASRSRMRR